MRKPFDIDEQVDLELNPKTFPYNDISGFMRSTKNSVAPTFADDGQESLHLQGAHEIKKEAGAGLANVNGDARSDPNTLFRAAVNTEGDYDPQYDYLRRDITQKALRDNPVAGERYAAEEENQRFSEQRGYTPNVESVRGRMSDAGKQQFDIAADEEILNRMFPNRSGSLERNPLPDDFKQQLNDIGEQLKILRKSNDPFYQYGGAQEAGEAPPESGGKPSVETAAIDPAALVAGDTASPESTQQDEPFIDKKDGEGFITDRKEYGGLQTDEPFIDKKDPDGFIQRKDDGAGGAQGGQQGTLQSINPDAHKQVQRQISDGTRKNAWNSERRDAMLKQQAMDLIQKRLDAGLINEAQAAEAMNVLASNHSLKQMNTNTAEGQIMANVLGLPTETKQGEDYRINDVMGGVEKSTDEYTRRAQLDADKRANDQRRLEQTDERNRMYEESLDARREREATRLAMEQEENQLRSQGFETQVNTLPDGREVIAYRMPGQMGWSMAGITGGDNVEPGIQSYSDGWYQTLPNGEVKYFSRKDGEMGSDGQFYRYEKDLREDKLGKVQNYGMKSTKPDDVSLWGEKSEEKESGENKGSEKPPVDGAKQADDGKWYVQKDDGKWYPVVKIEG